MPAGEARPGGGQGPSRQPGVPAAHLHRSSPRPPGPRLPAGPQGSPREAPPSSSPADHRRSGEALGRRRALGSSSQRGASGEQAQGWAPPLPQGIGISAARSSGRAAGGAPGYPRVPAHVPHGLSQHKTVRGRDGRPLDPRGRGQGLRSSRSAARVLAGKKPGVTHLRPAPGTRPLPPGPSPAARTAPLFRSEIRVRAWTGHSLFESKTDINGKERQRLGGAPAVRRRRARPSPDKLQLRPGAAPAHGASRTQMGPRRQRCEGGESGQHPLARLTTRPPGSNREKIHPCSMGGENPGCRTPHSPRNSPDREDNTPARRRRRARRRPSSAAGLAPCAGSKPPGIGSAAPRQPERAARGGRAADSPRCDERHCPRVPRPALGGPPPRASVRSALCSGAGGCARRESHGKGGGGLAGNSSPPCSII